MWDAGGRPARGTVAASRSTGTSRLPQPSAEPPGKSVSVT